MHEKLRQTLLNFWQISPPLRAARPTRLSPRPAPAHRGMRQTLQDSFSAVSKPNFASKYAFESSRRDLHNALLCTAPKSHFFKKLVEFSFNLPTFAKFEFSEILRNSQFFKQIFCENFEIAAVQKDANLVELENCCQTHIFLQNFVLIQPRTSPPKICKNFAWLAKVTLSLIHISEPTRP